MNAERLHAIARAVKAELDATRTPDLLSEMASALQQQVANPADPSFQLAVGTSRQQLAQGLAELRAIMLPQLGGKASPNSASMNS